MPKRCLCQIYTFCELFICDIWYITKKVPNMAGVWCISENIHRLDVGGEVYMQYSLSACVILGWWWEMGWWGWGGEGSRWGGEEETGWRGERGEWGERVSSGPISETTEPDSNPTQPLFHSRKDWRGTCNSYCASMLPCPIGTATNYNIHSRTICIHVCRTQQPLVGHDSCNIIHVHVDEGIRLFDDYQPPFLSAAV